jgi:molybdopterin-guanine dinucleotide biosynthesis protein A
MQLVSAAEETQPVGAVLAGGEGTRIAGSKAMVELGGRPLISYPLGAVIAAGLEPLVVAKLTTELPDLDVPIVRERAPDAHPLHGVIAALELADGRPVVVVACDMPFVSRELLAWLGCAAGSVLPQVRGIAQPLLARYEAAASAPLAAALRDGRSVRAAVAALRPRLVDEGELTGFGDPLRLFFNVNDGRDLKRAAALLGPVF